jgi:hypothetical protein
MTIDCVTQATDFQHNDSFTHGQCSRPVDATDAADFKNLKRFRGEAKGQMPRVK